VLESRNGRVNLIVADVVMPDMGGRDLAARAAERWPHLPVLFTSGYTGMDVVHRGLLEEGTEFLQKPLAPDALARKVREMVDPISQRQPPLPGPVPGQRASAPE
jgi:DNA-binding NtrC family response regulator